MKRAVLIALAVLVLVYIGAIFVPLDPAGTRPGTGVSGNLAEIQNTDWSFLSDRNQIYVETRTRYLVPHSITVNSWVADGTLYVGCRACDAKYWPTNVARDDRVRLKIGDDVYERRAIRLNDELRRKALGVPAAEPLPDMAVFRMDPRD
jgi:hypothetical protein